jgi:hypothetical protein
LIALLAMLPLSGAPDVASNPVIRIDPCVQVDGEEVRRVTAIELSGSRPQRSLAELEVDVACRNGVEEIQLIDRVRARITVRSIDLRTRGDADLGAPAAEARDAKARELALAIAELLRRTEGESALGVPTARVAPSPGADPGAAGSSSGEPRPLRLELDVAGVLEHFTAGETLFGADLSGRLHVASWLIAELRLGGRKTKPVALERGAIDGHGVTAAAGLALDLTPGMHRAGVALGARLGGSWLRYAASQGRATAFAGKDAAAATLAGTATGFVMLTRDFCVVADASVGTALHAIVIRENDRRLSGMRGVFMSSAIGLGAHF